MDILVFYLILEKKNCQLLTIECNANCRLTIDNLSYVEICSWHPILWRVFDGEILFNLIKWLLCMYWHDLLSFVFIWKWKKSLFMWDSSCFLVWACIAVYFSFRTASAVFQALLCLHFHLFLDTFKIYSLVSSLMQWSLSSVLFSLHMLEVFPLFFLWLITSSIPLWSEKWLIWFISSEFY